MLTRIDIRNFAIIEHLALELEPGMTVLTGETGAGKSILIDALNLALGDRAEAGVIRHGSERAEVAAGFAIEALDTVQQWLAEHDIEHEGECLLRRTIGSEGRSKGYINGSPVPMQLLKELGEMLVDIHGQHEHQSLLRPDMQRQLLDDYAGHNTVLAELGKIYQRWNRAQQNLQELRRVAADRNARLELIAYQVQELQALNLGATELAELNNEHARLANASKLLTACHAALQQLYENEEASALGLLAHAVRELDLLQAYDQRLGAAHELLSGALIQGQEGVNELRHYLDIMELDPERLQWIEQRQGSIYDLARKHRVAAEQLPQRLTELSEELHTLKDMDLRQEQLQSEIEQAARDYRALAVTLSQGRARAAHELGERVSAIMQRLSMAGGRFEVCLMPYDADHYSAQGVERVEFRVSANPGQPLRPLNKVASGGELSRISLAIQVITAQTGRIPTLIFDEVDVGIGGGVAEIVGQQLRALSHTRQVLCVTHLAQVAAQGQQHIQVSKQIDKGVTRISVAQLATAERREEIARMLGGVKITEQTLAHAGEMLALAQPQAKKGKKARAKG